VTTRSTKAFLSSRGLLRRSSRLERRPSFLDSLAPWGAPVLRCPAAIRGSSSSVRKWSSSQRQTAFAGAVGDRSHPTVVLVAAAVEDHGVDPGGLGTLGDELADLAGLGGLVVAGGAQVGLERRGGRHGLADRVVDDLHHHVARGAGHDEA